MTPATATRRGRVAALDGRRARASAGHPTLGAGGRAAVAHALLILPVLVTFLYERSFWVDHVQALDFHHEYWVAGFRLLHGTSPYAWTRAQIASGAAFPYPGFAALLFAPFALLSRATSDVLFTGICIASLLGALRALDVTDRRVYGIVLLFCPVIAAWQTANLTLVLVLGVALAWRFRDRVWATALAAGLSISLKLLVWPLILWLLATRRYRAAVGAGLIAVGVNLVAYSVLGFDQIASFIHLTSTVTRVLDPTGYGLIALAGELGIGHAAGAVIELVLVAALAVYVMRAGRRGQEQAALALAVLLMIVASPLVWNHYFAFLLVPLALARPRLDRAWLAPLVLWLCSIHGSATWEVLVWWAVVAAFTFDLVRRSGSGPASAR